MKPPRPINGFAHSRAACNRKRRFDDEGAAWEKLLKVRRVAPEDGATQQPYHCTHCGGWHLGHRPGTRDENGEMRGGSGRAAITGRHG